MGAVSFSVPRPLVDALAAVLQLEVFVETGTFEGDGVAAVLDCFPEVHSVELSPVYFEAASRRFADVAHVRIVHGDSAPFLRDLAPSLAGRSVLYYLDAHWCAEEDTAGSFSQCPLLAEIEALGTLANDSVVLIDDARLFLATPRAPHEASNWPSFDHVLRALRKAGAAHRIMVVNDVIAFYPASCESTMKEYAHVHGVDWLRSRQALDENAALRADLEAKEAVLREQDTALTVMRAADAAREQRLRELMQQDSEATLSVAASNEAALANNQQLTVLMRMLEEKEAVIREVTAAMYAYKGAFILFSFLLVPLNFVASRVRRLARLVLRLLLPRLGALNQHTPRELRLPPDHAGDATARARPRITLVTPSYNQAQFIERTIESVTRQGYPDLEYVVQDGGSGDGTVEILERHAARITRWESRPDGGQSEAINRAFAGTTGEIMAWLNSDDVLFPGALAYVADYFARHPEVDVIYGHRILIDEQDRQIGRWILPAHSDKVLSWADFVPQETLFWRRRIWDKAGGCVDESFRFAMDWDLLLRFREAGARFQRVPRFLGAFRIHGRQKTSSTISDVGMKEMDRLRQRVLGRVPGHGEIRKALAPYLARHVAIDLPWKLRDGIGTYKEALRASR